MATYRVLCWKDLHAQIKAQGEGGRVSVQLSERFQEKIDRVAMEQGLFGTDEYLEHWKWGDRQEREGTAQEVADAACRELEDAFEA